MQWNRLNFQAIKRILEFNADKMKKTRERSNPGASSLARLDARSRCHSERSPWPEALTEG